MLQPVEESASSARADELISPYTLTYKESGSLLPVDAANGASVTHHAPLASMPDSSGHHPVQSEYHNAAVPALVNGKELETNGLLPQPANFNGVTSPHAFNADSPYVQMPAVPATENSGTAISPYTVIEQMTLEPVRESDRPAAVTSNDPTGDSSTPVGNERRLLPDPDEISDDDVRNLTRDHEPAKQPSVSPPSVDGYVSWPPPEPSNGLPR